VSVTTAATPIATPERLSPVRDAPQRAHGEAD
jgi:hypothetical protein